MHNMKAFEASFMLAGLIFSNGQGIVSFKSRCIVYRLLIVMEYNIFNNTNLSFLVFSAIIRLLFATGYLK